MLNRQKYRVQEKKKSCMIFFFPSFKIGFCHEYFVLEIFSNLMAETKDSEVSQICIVSVKFLKDVRDFDRNAANWQ
jgi:hypothetical protein